MLGKVKKKYLLQMQSNDKSGRSSSAVCPLRLLVSPKGQSSPQEQGKEISIVIQTSIQLGLKICICISMSI